MNGSLQEQLLKAGLIDEDRLQNAKKSGKKPAKKNKRSFSKHKEHNTSAKSPPRPTTQSRVQSTTQPTTEAKVIEDPKKQKALRVEVKKLLRSHKLNDKAGEIAYNYTINNQVKRFFVSETQQKELIDGNLAIANWNDISYLIPAAAVKELRELYPKIDISVAEVPSNDHKTGSNDPYADYAIPDELKW